MTRPERMRSRRWTAVVCVAVATSASFWAWRLFAAAPTLQRLAEPTVAASRAVQRDLRIVPDIVPPSTLAAPRVEVAVTGAELRFQLLGVMSFRSAQSAARGLAVIAVDGQPAKVVRVGAIVDGQHVLQAVGERTASLGLLNGAAAIVLRLASEGAAVPRMQPLGTTPAVDGTALGPGTTTGHPGPTAANVMQATAPPSKSAVRAQPAVFQSAQQLFHQRQQIQFQQEQLQNQGPYTANPPAVQSAVPKAERSDAR